MNPFSVLNIFCGIIYLVLGLYAIGLDPRSRMNKVFFNVCMSFAIWAFCYAFLHDPGITTAERHFWYDVSSFGWCLFPGFTMHLIFLFTKREQLLEKWWIWLPLYGPGCFFVFREFTGTLASVDFVRVGFGFREVPPIHLVEYWIFFLYQIGYAVTGILLLHLWGRSTQIQREKRQARVIVWSATITLFLGLAIDILLPMADFSLLPSMSPIVAVILAYGFWLAISRYKLMSFTLARASDDIILKMKDLLMLLDPSGTIVMINPRLTEVLGYDEERTLQHPFTHLLRNPRQIEGHLEQLVSNRISQCECDTDMITVTGETIPMKISASMLHDQFGDPIGIVMICSDLRERRRLEKEIKERQRAEEHLRKRNDLIEWDLVNAQVSQKALLPDSVPLHERLLTDFRYFPMASVGGDYFTFIPFKTDELGVFIGDVSGHGVSAALFLLLLKAEFDRACRNFGLMPRELIDTLNENLTESMHYYFLTALYGYFDFPDESSTIFSFTSGGHPEPVLYRKATGRVELLHCEGPLLGRFNDAEFHQSRIELEPGDRLFLMTDGLFETRNGECEMFTQDRLLKLIEAAGEQDLPAVFDGIFSALDRFRGPAQVEDDIILIGFEVRPPF